MTHTDAEIIAAARAAVEEYGADYVYPESERAGGHGNCHYAEDDGTPSCIVGHIVARLDPSAFATIVDDHALNYETSASDLTFAGFEITFQQGRALGNAQFYQDAGKPWGTAFAEIEERLGAPS